MNISELNNILSDFNHACGSYLKEHMLFMERVGELSEGKDEETKKILELCKTANLDQILQLIIIDIKQLKDNDKRHAPYILTVIKMIDKHTDYRTFSNVVNEVKHNNEGVIFHEYTDEKYNRIKDIYFVTERKVHPFELTVNNRDMFIYNFKDLTHKELDL